MIEKVKQTAEFLKRIGQNSAGADFQMINSTGAEEQKHEDPWKDIFSEKVELGKSQNTLESLA